VIIFVLKEKGLFFNISRHSRLRHHATSQKVVESIHYEVTEFFNWPNSSSRHYAPDVDSASNRNEYQEFSGGGGGKGRPARKADNIVAICEPIV
jgi:hypothetical protein